MRVRFLELAQYELDDAYSWYEEQMPGLGRELLDEVDRSIRRALAWVTVSGMSLGSWKAPATKTPGRDVSSGEKRLVLQKPNSLSSIPRWAMLSVPRLCPRQPGPCQIR